LSSLYSKWLSATALPADVLSKGTWYFGQWYQNSSTDYRFVYLTKVATFGWNNNNILMKFIQPAGYETEYALRIPMIRRSLVYYIAAECETDLANATEYLNRVRRNRGITADLSGLTEASLAVELQREYIKELWGEGHFFFFLKRRNVTSNPTDRWLPFQIRDKYIIDKPDAEIEYGL
jgi:hypothetical protein